MRFTALLATLIAAVPALAQRGAEYRAEPSETAGYHIYSHAHNDYEHERPLLDALDNRFHSVEADFWLVDGELLVAHDQGDYKGSLKDLYLDPLQKRVDDMGSVHGDGLTFYLWLDIKDGRGEVVSVLRELLDSYSMLTVFDDGNAPEWNPVVAILTGDHGVKTAYVDSHNPRRACRDSNHFSPDDPGADNRWRWYALNWGSHFSWRGRGELPDGEREKLLGMIEAIHAKGRKVRFYATPDLPTYWQLALQTGVDLINTDRLEVLNQFLEELYPALEAEAR